LAGKHQLLIGGKWLDAESGKRFDVFDPATGQAIAAVAEADAADIDEAVKAARSAFEEGPWSQTSPQDRCKLIWKLADLLEHNADEIAEIESLDNAKPIRDARNVDLPGSALHGRLGDQDQRRDDHRLGARQLARLHTARACRGCRADHPVEFPADDGGVE